MGAKPLLLMILLAALAAKYRKALFQLALLCVEGLVAVLASLMLSSKTKNGSTGSRARSVWPLGLMARRLVELFVAHFANQRLC
jgi:hypothetical protein